MAPHWYYFSLSMTEEDYLPYWIVLQPSLFVETLSSDFFTDLLSNDKNTANCPQRVIVVFFESHESLERVMIMTDYRDTKGEECVVTE